jgi:hypothetical protein
MKPRVFGVMIMAVVLIRPEAAVNVGNSL